MNENREFVRHESLNLVSYILFNSNDEIINQGVGRSLDISKGGILLEIEDLIDDEINTIRMEIALDDNIVSVDGRVAFTLLTTEGYTECGIQFKNTSSEIQANIQDYIDKNLRLKKKKPSPLRTKNTRIDSIELTLSNDHKIISDYIDSYRSMVETPENEFTMQNLSKLITFMAKDLSDHFYFEEEAVFKGSLSGSAIQTEIQVLVEKFKKDHAILINEMNAINSYIKLWVNEQKNTDTFIIRKTYLFMGQIKKHNREEMELLLPLIDQDKEKLKHINALLI